MPSGKSCVRLRCANRTYNLLVQQKKLLIVEEQHLQPSELGYRFLNDLLPEHLKRIRTHTGTLKIRRRPGRDCRDPESMEGEQRHVPVIWVPAIPAGMTLDLTIHYFV